MKTAAVTDAGPLIHLAEIDSLDLLGAFESLLVPKTVHDEVATGGLPDGLRDVVDDVVTATADVADGLAELDAGERAAIAVAEERGVVLLTDDLAARDAASGLGVDVHGSIGVIALGYSDGRLEKEAAASRMRALQRTTSLFVTEAVVERGIRLLDEQ